MHPRKAQLCGLERCAAHQERHIKLHMLASILGQARDSARKCVGQQMTIVIPYTHRKTLLQQKLRRIKGNEFGQRYIGEIVGCIWGMCR